MDSETATLVRERRNDVFRRMKGIVDAAGDRPLTQAQASDFQTLLKEFDRASDALGQPRLMFSSDAGSTVAKDLVSKIDTELSKPAPRKIDQSSLDEPRGDVSDASGEVKVLRKGDRLTDGVSSLAGAGLTLDRYVKAIVLGDWSGIPLEAKAMSVGTGSAGGYMVPELLSSRVIDKARNRARVLEAGALTVPMRTGTMFLARVAGDPTAAWKAENAAATASDLTLERVTLTARTLMAYVKASVELVEDAESIETTIENAMAQALALELDRAALCGSGTAPEPRGIKNTSGINTVSAGANGGPASYDLISQGIEAIQTANGEPNAYIMAPRTSGSLSRLRDDIAQPLQPSPDVAELDRFVSSQIPVNLTQGTASNASDIYVGDFTELLIGVRRELVIEASREASDATDSAFRQLQVHIRAYLRADVAVAQPSHFTVITGIVP